MKELLKRVFLETPNFFKKLRNLGLSLAAVSAAVINVPKIPEWLLNLANEGVWIGAVIAIVSQLTVKNPEDLKQ